MRMCLLLPKTWWEFGHKIESSLGKAFFWFSPNFRDKTVPIPKENCISLVLQLRNRPPPPHSKFLATRLCVTRIFYSMMHICFEIWNRKKSLTKLVFKHTVKLFCTLCWCFFFGSLLNFDLCSLFIFLLLLLMKRCQRFAIENVQSLMCWVYMSVVYNYNSLLLHVCVYLLWYVYLFYL